MRRTRLSHKLIMYNLVIWVCGEKNLTTKKNVKFHLKAGKQVVAMKWKVMALEKG